MPKIKEMDVDMAVCHLWKVQTSADETDRREEEGVVASKGVLNVQILCWKTGYGELWCGVLWWSTWNAFLPVLLSNLECKFLTKIHKRK